MADEDEPNVSLLADRSSGRPSVEPAEVVAAARDRRNLFGDYVLVQPVGFGGAGIVYRAWQRSLRRFVALKLLHQREQDDAERGAREAQLAARLSHPHIVPIYEVGQHDGQQYLTMKLIAGVAMSKVALEPARAVALMRRVAEAVEHAHVSGIVHRDLKPQNLLLEEGGHVWVTDFGLARQKEGGSTLTAAGAVVGTPAYMPPEQARALRCDERSDVYALGATLYHLLAGRPPFQGETALGIMMEQLRSDPAPLRRVNPRVHVEVETIVGKAMARAPDRRYPSARAFAEDLRRHLEGEPILARPPILPVRAGKWALRHPLASAAIGLVAAVVVVGALYMAGVTRARREAERRLADTLVAEANALGAAGRWEQARARYAQAEESFRRLGVASPAPELGLLDADHHAPPPLLVLTGHTGTVRGLAFLPGGRQVLSASDDHTLRLWDLGLGREIRVFHGHSREVTSVALSADGRLALSGGRDGTLRLWDVASGRTLHSIGVRGGAVTKVALSPDGHAGLSNTTEGIVQFWDLTVDREQRSLAVPSRRVIAVAFSPDGRRALTGQPLTTPGVYTQTNSRANLWDLEAGQVLQTLGGFNFEVESLTFSSDGRRALSAGFDQHVTVWDVGSGRPLLTLKGHLHGVTGASFAHGDRVIVSASQDRTIKLWDGNSGRLLRTLNTGDPVEAMAVAPDGALVVTGGADRALKVWDPTVGQEVRTFSGHRRATQAVAFSADGRLAVSGGREGKLSVWDVATGRAIRSLDTGTSLHAVALSPDGRTALAGGSTFTVGVWDVTTGKRLRTLVGHTHAVRTAVFSPDGRRALSCSEAGEIKIWELATGEELQAWKHGDDVRRVVFSPDGRLVLSGSFDGTAKLWDVATGAEVRTFAPAGSERIWSVAISRDGRWAMTGSQRGTLHLWELASGRLVRTLEGHTGDVREIRFSPDGTVVLSASGDRTVRAWDLETGREMHAFAWADERTWSFATSGDGRFALAGNEDGSMNFWDFERLHRHRSLAAGLPAALATLARDPEDASALATLGEWYAFRGVSSWAIELLERAEKHGVPVSPLMLARSHWRAGDLVAARRELARARSRQEAPPEYLDLLVANLGLSDQGGRLSAISLADGRVRYPFLGIRSETVAGGGVRVTALFPDGPAARAGLQVGDVVVAADHDRLLGDGALERFLAPRSAGAEVAIELVRNGLRITLATTLTERPARSPDAGGHRLRVVRTGWSLQTLTPALAAALGIDPATRGAVVTDVEGNRPGPLELRGLIEEEDVLVAVDGKPVTTAQEAAAAIEGLPSSRWDTFRVVRPGNVR